MGKKFMNTVLFLAVAAAAAMLTAYVGKGSGNVLFYNFAFLGIMVLIYAVGLFAGLYRMDNLTAALRHGASEITEVFQLPGRARKEEIGQLRGLFGDKYLDKKMDDFVDSISRTEEGIAEVEDFVNIDDVDVHIHKRLLEMAPDIFTSLGILGTFIGLVWGLKNFQPTDYEVMTTSVSALVDGIKVAFLTSIYGVALSVVYTFGMKSGYSSMSQAMQDFLDRFHALVLPTAENESWNLLVSSQKTQTEAMKQMAEQFSVQMADSFEKVITPTFRKMNDSLDMLTASVTKGQQDAIREILDTFLSEMHGSFQMQFEDFNDALSELKKAQKDNTEYTSELYKTMSSQLSETFTKQERAMRDAITEIDEMQSKYMKTADRIIRDNQMIQQLQKREYEKLAEHMHENEKASSDLWKSCNESMRQYVDSAAEGMKTAADSNKISAELLREDKKMIGNFETKMREFTESQKMVSATLDEVRRLLSEIKTAKNNRDIHLVAGQPWGYGSGAGVQELKEKLDSLEDLLDGQGARQEALLDEIERSIREMTKVAQKGRFGLFK